MNAPDNARFTEADVRTFFNETTSAYLQFWDAEGVLHTGMFENAADTDYQGAAARTSDLIEREAGIDPDAHVLDVGCGCGNFLMRLAEHTGCGGEGLDLSEERIAVANDRLTGQTDPWASRISFRQGSATDLPYREASFSHVVSQDALFLVPDKKTSHAELLRVLRPGGLLAFSDFLQPVPEIGASARTHVYDRVRWSGGYSLTGYLQALEAAGFEIVLARNLRAHIRQTYQVLGKIARQRSAALGDSQAGRWIAGFAASCDEIQQAIDRNEFGWGVILARKPA